jgi:NAD(P)-dependent dehydrogenase (short-subunit alcohol dehydrogenase family)
MSEFTNAVVLVTGAGRGIGRAIALAFASQGAILAVNDLTPVNLDETAAQIRSVGAQVKDYIFDIAKKMPVEAMVDEVLQDWGRIEFLINNAGVHPTVPLLDMDEWDFRRTLDVNLCGPFFATQLVGRAMRSQGGGVIVNLATALGRAQDLKDSAAYFASKMGLIGLTQAAAHELAPFNIRVNAVCPGWIETEGIRTSGRLLSMMKESLSQIPQTRVGRPEEVANLVVSLCSRSASYLTGQAINLDGGLVMS